MRKSGFSTNLRYRATRLRSRLGLAGLWAADRLETLCDWLAVGLLRAEGHTWGAPECGWEHVPNDLTAAALRDGREGKNLVWFNSAEDFLAGLNRQRVKPHRLNGPVGILRPVVPPRRSPNGLARRNDHLAIRAIAEHRPRASILTVETVLLEFRERGVCVSIAEAELIGRRVTAAATYQPAARVNGDVLDGRD